MDDGLTLYVHYMHKVNKIYVYNKQRLINEGILV